MLPIIVINIKGIKKKPIPKNKNKYIYFIELLFLLLIINNIFG